MPTLATIVFCIFLIRVTIFIVQKLKKDGINLEIDKKLWGKYLSCFISGVLFANAIPHFVHGISGEHFPAPLGQFLGSGFPEYLSNVIWGFINIVFGYNQFVIGGVSNPDKWRKIFFFAGFLAMSIFLAFVFSHFNQ